MIQKPYWMNKNTLTDETSRFTGALNASLKTDRLGGMCHTQVLINIPVPIRFVAQAVRLSRYQNGYMSKGDVNYQYNNERNV